METITTYLQQKFTPYTAKRYERDILQFIEEMDAPQTATQLEITAYIGKQRERYNNPQTLQVVLCAIKQYYQFLVDTRSIQKHPCKYLKLKDKLTKDIQLQDFFSAEELALLLQRKERYQDLKYRNKVILSLLIFQGLTTGEITRIQLHQVDLDTAEIFIMPSPMLNGRTLKLKAEQVMWFYKYIHLDRDKLLQKDTKNLIINKLGNPETGEQISYLVSTCKGLFTDRKLNPRTIRQSVITNLLNEGKDLRLVQVFAGHKYPSATEKYKQSGSEELKAQILKNHPLG
jgi:integrase/recombinase XerD